MRPQIAEMHEVSPGVFLGLIPGDGLLLDAPKQELEKLYFTRYGHMARNEKELNEFTRKLMTRLARRMGLPVHKRLKSRIMQY